MSREIKYTTDGKKVVVIGSLNSQEKIVQEIFIVDGSEIPSGEHFVVKSLHDAPAISWKTDDLKKKDAYYEKRKKEIESELDRLERAYRIRRTELVETLNYTGSVLKKVSPDSFNTLVNYLTGAIKFVVISIYDPEIMAFEEFEKTYDGQMRLVSLFGKDDGTFTYSMGQYYDYSGGSKHFTPFTNFEDALECLKTILLKKGVNETTLKTAKKYNIQFPEAEIKEYFDKRNDQFLKNIDQYQKQIDSWKNEMDKALTQ